MINYIYKSILLIIAFLFAIRLLQLIKYFEFLLCTSTISISIAVAKCVLLTLIFLTKIIFLLFSIDFKIYYFFCLRNASNLT